MIQNTVLVTGVAAARRSRNCCLVTTEAPFGVEDKKSA